MITVLIADDLHENRDILESFLKDNDYQVVTASNGKEALEILGGQSVDLIITDILMPEMDGYMLCKQIKSDPRWKNIPIIIYSATFTSRQDEIFAIKLGATRFVRKPVDSEIFLNIIQEVLRSSSNGTLESPQIRFKTESDAFKLYNERIIQKLEEKASELEESEARYKSIYNNTTIGLYRTTPDGKIIMANPALIKMLGFDSFEEMVKRNLEKEGYHPEYPRAEFKRIMEKEGKIQGWESTWQRKDGTFVHILESASAIYDKNGKIKYYEGNIEDITARKTAEASLQESQNRLSKAAKMARLGYWDYDVAENLFTFDDHFYAIFNTTAQEVGGYKLTPEEYAKRFLYPDDQELVGIETRKALETTDPNFSRSLEHRIVYADGGVGWVSVNFFIVKNSEGRTIRTFGVNQDITEHKRLQEVIANEQKELKLIIDTSPVLIFYKDKDGKFIRVNSAFAKMLRMKEADFLGKTVFDLYTKEIAQSMTNDDREVFKSNRPRLNIIEQYQSASGLRWVQTDKIPIQDENGDLVGLIGFALDITDLKQTEQNLIAERDKLQRVTDGLSAVEVGIDIVDLDYRVIYQNSFLKNRFGNLRTELCYEKYMNLKEPCSFCPMVKAIETNLPQKVEMTGSDGKTYELLSTPLPDPDGAVNKVIEIVRDITERRQSEEALRKSENMLKLISENSRDIICLHDSDHKYVYVSPACKTLLGYKPEELVGTNPWELVHPQDLESLQNEGPTKAEKEGISFLSYRIRKKSGKYIWFESASQTIRDDKGKIMGYVTSSRDITERKKADEVIRESERHYRELINGMNETVWIIDFNGKLIDVNRTAVETLGYSKKELLKIGLFGIDSSLTRENIKALAKSMSGDKIQIFETSHKSKDGKIIPVEIYSSLTNYHGKPAILSIARDISERRQAEAALKESEERYRSVVEYSQNGILIVGEDFRFIYVNDTLCNLLDRSREKIIGHDFREFLDTESTALVADIYLRRRRGDDVPNRYEFNILRENGEKRRVEISSTVFKDSKGKILTIAQIMDITERKQAEENIRRVTVGAHAILWRGKVNKLVDKSEACQGFAWNVNYINLENICKFIPLPESAGHDLSERYRNSILEEDRRNMENISSKALRENAKNYKQEFRLRDANNSLHWMREDVSINRIDETHFELIGFIIDITDRKRAEEELRESEERYRLITDNSVDAILLTDPNGPILSANKAAREMFQMTEKEICLLGRNGIVDVEDPRLPGLLEKRLKDGFIKSELTMIRKDGSKFPAEITSAVFKNSKGEPRTSMIIRDITKRKKDEDALREERDKFARIVNTAPGAICSFCTESSNSIYFTYASHSVEDIFGFSPDALVRDATVLTNYFNPLDAIRVNREIQESHRQLSYWQSQFRYNHPKKGEIWIFASFEPVREAENKTAWYGILMEITARKRAEEDLNRVMEGAQAILWHSPVVRRKGAKSDGREFLWQTRYFNLDAIKNTIPLSDYPSHNLNDMYYYSILEEDRQKMDQVSSTALKSGAERYDQEFRLRDANGVIHWMHEDARVRQIDESHYEVAGVITEVTERKKAELALRISEEKFKDLFEFIRSGVMIYRAVEDGTDFMILNLNRASAKIDKVKRNNIIGKSVQKIFPGVKEFGLFEVLQRVWRTGQAESFPLTLYKDNRISGWRENYVFKLPTGEIVAVYDDVTKQRQAEEERLKSERYFRLVWENSVDGMRLSDENGTVVMVNDTYCDIVNLPKEKLEGQPFTTIYTKEKQAENLEHYLQRFKGKIDQNNFEMKMILHNGKKVWFSLSDSYLEINPGKRLLLTIIRDITEQKNRQLEQEELQAQLTQIQKIEAIGNLAGGIAHDFNNLLTVIQGHAQILLMPKNESDPEYAGLKHIMNTCTKATNLTRQLLLFGRKQTLELKPLDINDTVSNLLKMIKRLIGEHINIVTDLKTPLMNIEADEGNLEQIILNLVVNSRDAMPNGGTLTIKTENVTITNKNLTTVPNARLGKFVCLSITDTGSGISKEIIAKIFEPFFTTKDPGKGTGLGLSVVYGIIKKHNGWINVDTAVDRGTTMKVYFPITEKNLSEATKVSVDNQIYRGNGEMILVVEDNSEVLKFTASILSNNNYTPIEAATAAQAFNQFEKGKGQIKLILSDIGLPDKNGIQVAEEILSINAGLPIILYTGYTDETIMRSIKRNQNFHLLQKPFQVEDLLQLIYQLLHPDYDSR